MTSQNKKNLREFGRTACFKPERVGNLLSCSSSIPMIVPLPVKEASQITSLRTWNGRGFAWGAVIIGSRLPELICRQFGLHTGLWISPLSETLVLLFLAIVAYKLCSVKDITGFVFAIALLAFSWGVVVPWIESSEVFHDISRHLSWGARFFLMRAIRTVGALLVIPTLIGSGIGRRELFLRLGTWQAQVQSEPFFRFRRTITWRRLGLALLLIFAVVLPGYLFSVLDLRIDRISGLLFVLPWAIATSALNAASEEFQFRSVPLAHLRNVVPVREAYLLVAALFGIGHYFGQPSGWGGMLMAGFAGWLWAKSMVETKGFSFAFATHFVQDIVMFCFLAISETDLSSAWS